METFERALADESVRIDGGAVGDRLHEAERLLEARLLYITHKKNGQLESTGQVKASVALQHKHLKIALSAVQQAILALISAGPRIE